MAGSGDELALGIDLGTTNVKAVLVAPDGSQRGAATRSLTTTTRGDSSTQDPVALWDAVEAVVREAVEASGRPTVNAVGVCSQYSSIVPVDEAGLPTGPMLMWTDTRGSDHCWAIMERHPEAFAVWVERHGIPTVGSGLSLAHLLFVQHDLPDLHARTATYLEPMDYVIARLTARRCATQATMFTSQLCDNRTVGTTTYDDELIAMSGIDASKLPPLVALDAEVGPVDPEVAELLGLSPDAPVFAGINDSQAGAFATGAFDHHRLGLMIGTTAVLLDTVGHRDADLDHEIVAMPAPSVGRYLVWAENGVAGRSVEHALGLLDVPMSRLDDLVAEAKDTEAQASSVPAATAEPISSASKCIRLCAVNTVQGPNWPKAQSEISKNCGVRIVSRTRGLGAAANWLAVPQSVSGSTSPSITSPHFSGESRMKMAATTAISSDTHAYTCQPNRQPPYCSNSSLMGAITVPTPVPPARMIAEARARYFLNQNVAKVCMGKAVLRARPRPTNSEYDR